ncbi:hypothetical protein ACFPIJ_20330 [Dactylosporangium cerinum]|uniref:Uncharacterized protein n=1 Tax=Dactylosporangium cerinum TaxID=1434730 RepID=A0ABV9VXN3_9ACTN
MTRDPREEAERLVATALAALSVAANSTAGFATGSAECCVCPVCKAIAAARDPDPEFAERLATGVGDLAVGLAGVLRAFGQQQPKPASTPETPEPPEDVWQSATTETPMSPKPMAKKAVKPKIDPEA